ncbi:MAG TPA: SpoIIE family protein phosphatase [Thermoanaerobaculia bacterium]|nr:SpoIIE family protein phosphatase [Thermoanaerobaculia bacterium]
MRRVVVLLAMLFFCACARRADVPRLEDGWTHERRGSDLHMRAPLPAGHHYSHLVFRAYVGELTVLVDGRAVSAFYDPFQHGRLQVHVVPIARGRSVEIVVHHAPRGDVTIVGGAPYLATSITLPYALDRATLDPLRDDLSDILLGILLLVVGTIALIASPVRRRGDAPALRHFGLFTLLYGLRLLVDSYLPSLLGVPLRLTDYAEAFITYVIPIPGWALPMRLIGNGWRSTLRWQVYVFIAFAPIGIVTDLVTRTPGSLETVNNVLVIAGGVNILLNLLYAPQRRTLELRVVLFGAVVFLLFALNNNLTALGVLPWSFHEETLGFIVFVAALGFAATRAFVRGERERLAIDNELATAREIQRAILPTSMPDVPGLTFRAGYDPASSVAGDLYDVRADGNGASVLVADVAGHGVPAALIASMVKIAVASQASLVRDPAAMLRALNDILRREVRRAFVTATMLWLDMDQRRVTVCNAGHPAPLLYRDGTFTELGAEGVLLGRFPVSYTATTTELRPGDRIVAFTDGIVEARNARGEQFGEERLMDVIRAGGDVLEAVHDWRGETDEDADDLTFVLIEVTERR